MAYLTEVKRKRKWYFDCQLQDLAERFKWLNSYPLQESTNVKVLSNPIHPHIHIIAYFLSIDK